MNEVDFDIGTFVDREKLSDTRKVRLLFVCAANAQRSPSFENWFKINKPQYEVRSAGIYHGYPYQVNEEILNWADKIYLMDLSQEMFIFRRYLEFYDKCEVIGCSDQYSRDSPEIKELIWFWCKQKQL
jgi:predicted protein tyrosine phosphatase